MADYINKVVLKGRPGTKPQLRYLPSGDAVASFNLATKFGDHVEWHTIVAYKQMADRAVTFDAGDLVYVEGRIQSREFQTAEDKTLNRKPRKVTEIIVDAIHLVQPKGANDPNKQTETQQPPQQQPMSRSAQFPVQAENSDQDSYIPSYL